MNRYLLLSLSCALLLCSLTGCDGGQGSRQAASKQQDQGAEFPVAQKGVWPYLTGGDQQTKVAENLTAKNYVIVFDGSGSMTEHQCSGNQPKITVAKAAVAEWSRLVPKDANIGLVAFHQGKISQLPLAAGNLNKFVDNVQKIVPGGGTPLTAAFTKAYEMLTHQAQHQLGYGEYNIVVVTDGIADNPRSLHAWVQHVLERTPIVVHTIGFCIDEKHSLNQPGRTNYRTATNPDELRRGLKEVLAESESFDVSGFRR